MSPEPPDPPATPGSLPTGHERAAAAGDGPTPSPGWRRPALWTAAGLLGLAAVLGWEIVWTRPVRQSVRTYSELITAANDQDLDRARSLCSTRYLRAHPLRPAPEGGIVGLPRNIHKNFRAWRQGPHVWLCPTNRVGPLFQFVYEAGRWKFDGPIGLIQPRGRVLRLPEAESPPPPDPDDHSTAPPPTTP